MVLCEFMDVWVKKDGVYKTVGGEMRGNGVLGMKIWKFESKKIFG